MADLPITRKAFNSWDNKGEINPAYNGPAGGFEGYSDNNEPATSIARRMPIGPSLPFAALTIPIDIKRQYSFSRLDNVAGVVYESDEESLIVRIEFEFDGTFDEWTLPIIYLNDNWWHQLHCWKRTDQGLIG